MEVVEIDSRPEITIDPEFQSLIPALAPEEKAQLEANLVIDGCRDPLVVWWSYPREGDCPECGVNVALVPFDDIAICEQCQYGVARRQQILIDGHNRYEICTRRGIDFEIVVHDADTREEVIEWIVDNQVGRRNLNADWFKYFLGREYRAKKQQGARTDLTSTQNEEKLTTAEALAATHSVGRATVERAATFSEAVDALADNLGATVRNKVLDGDLKLSQGEVIALSRKDPDTQREVLDKVQAGARNMNAAMREIRHDAAKEIESVPDILPPPDVQRGQWWQLGRHLLYCGDTSRPEFYEKLPTADLAFADPPYNAGVAQWDSSFSWRHDWLMERSEVVAVTPGIASIFQFARITKMPYRWAAACWIANGMTRGELGFGNWIPVFLFANESLHCNSQDFLKVTINVSETEETKHRGRKPSELLLWLIETFTEPEQLVIDPFLGSGTTLYAAEKSNRVCIGGELEPEYCQAIIARWEAMTGQQAKEVTNGNPL